MKDHIPQRHLVLPLRAAPPRQANQAGQFAVGCARRRQRNQLQALQQVQFAANNEFNACPFGSDVSLHYACKRAFICDGDGRVAELRRALYQLVWVGGTAQEAVAAEGVEFGVGHGLRTIQGADHAEKLTDMSI